MGIIKTVGRFLGLSESPVDDASQNKQVSIHVESTGTSGTEIFSGYYSEEYLSTLRGTQAADTWDKIRRSDPKIKMVLSAVKTPIKSAHWSIQPGADGENYQLHADLIEQILFKDICQSWTQQISEILTFLDFGFSLFERVDKLVVGHPKFGSYHSLAKLAWRSQRTIERWNLDPVGGIVSVSQYAYGDLGRVVDIPGEFLIVFTNEKEGDNYEGISALRPCYGPWFRKNAFLKLMAIGMEKFAVPTPCMDVPEGKEDSVQYQNAKKVLEKYVSHQQQYITKPAGWTLSFAQSNFDASKIRSVINEENTEMAQAFLENFLELGQSGGGGSYALGTDLSDFFLMGLEYLGRVICDPFNRTLIPELIKLNFGPQDFYPELVCSGIKDKPGKELAEILKLFSDGRLITPDSDLEDNIREKYGLPLKMEAVAAPNISTPNIGTLAPNTLSEPVKLAEQPKTPKALITARTEQLKELMKSGLGMIGTQLVSDLVAKKKRSTPSQYLSITKQVEPKGVKDYSAQLKEFVSGVSREAIQQAKKEIPGGTKLKLSEFTSLPPSIQKAIESQIGLLSAFQIQDLLKAVYFQFNSSVESTDSDALLEADLNGTLEQFLEGASVAAGAGNTVARTVNEGRSEFFFDSDVIDEIESFTFVNGDPVSPICQDLAGTVFSKDDPDMGRYSPPLHHNCKSYLVANLKGSNKEIDPTGIKPSNPGLDKYITLSEISAGQFTIAYIEVSKKKAFTSDEAMNLAKEVTVVPILAGTLVESESSYRVNINDISILETGTLKSFEPMEGVNVYYGRTRALPLT